MTDDPSLPAFARSRYFPWIGAAPFVLWPLFILSRGEVRWEMIAVMVLVPLLAWKRRRLFTGLLPVGLVAFLYDAMRFVKNVGLSPERVHDCDLREAEVALFGLRLADGRMGTVHDALQAHVHPALDLLCAVPYGTYIFTILAAAIFLYRKDFHRLQRFTWTFLLLNIAGFITYHVFPAAPPWYFHAHGCAIDMAARASAGPNLTRVDAMLGFEYFRSFYGRSNDIFGAVPSLHVAYPTLLALETWPYLNRPMRAVAAFYAALMCFAAVYLDHHWVIDVIVGLSYTAVVLTLVRRAFRPAAPATP